MLQHQFGQELEKEIISLHVLASLHWLPTKFRIEFNILPLTYKALSDQAPSLLTELVVSYCPNLSLIHI